MLGSDIIVSHEFFLLKVIIEKSNAIGIDLTNRKTSVIEELYEIQ